MSLTALRQAAFAASRTYTVGGSVEAKRSDGEAPRADRSRKEIDGDGAVVLEQHWQDSIDAATD